MRKALVVGINDYPSYPLKGCVNDAISIADRLSVNDDGSPNFSCVRIVSPPDMITRASLLTKLRELFADKVDIAVFYFSGHGMLTDLGGILVTQDVQPNEEGVSMQAILDLINKAKADEILIVLDCCHSGVFAQMPSLASGLAVLRPGVTILTASAPDQTAKEVGGRGVFTSIICDALSGGAADVRGRVTTANVYSYVDQRLGPWDQRPFFKTHVSRLGVD